MKKIISFALLLALCLSLFAACTEPVDQGLLEAEEYLYASYKNYLDENVTASTFKMVGVVKIGETTYNVDWAVDNDQIKVTRGEDKMVTITIPDYPKAEINYVLTATISNDKGQNKTISYNLTVPKAIGWPVAIEDGTYVITANGLTMSSLAQSSGYGYPTGNQVTIADGAVTGHSSADVLTITNVEGGVTIQDAYGRYFYLKGTYNSFNVDATAPAEGHIWQVLTDDTNVFLINILNKKTLAYSASYSSWGAYPTLTKDHTSSIVITPATAPDVEPEPDPEPVEPKLPTLTAPVAGTAYKFGLFQVTNGTTLYVTGEVDGRYLVTTEDMAAAADVYVEEADGGLKFYILVDGAKKYIEVYFNADNKVSVQYSDNASVFSFNAECCNWVTNLDGTDYYLGTFSNFSTISASKTSYISKDNAGIEQFPAGFFAVVDKVTTPEVGVAYKMFVNHATISKTLYFVGTTANKDYYFTTSESIADGIDVYLEAVDGGYLLYFMAGDTKTYLDIYKNGKYINGRFTDAPTAVYTWNSEFGTLVATLEDGSTGYLGAYGTFATISASSTDYLGKDGSFWCELVKA